MNEQPITNPAASAQAAAEAQATQAKASHHSGGSAFLDAEVQASEQDTPTGENPSATNIAGNADPDASSKGKDFNPRGENSARAEELGEAYTPPGVGD